jgi:hypothetical protein
MRFSVWACAPLKHLYRALALVALLIAGQQGAVVHEMGHLVGAQSAGLHKSAGETADANCALCPLFAQVATAAVSHSLPIPLLLCAGIDRESQPQVEAIDTAVPSPRSRGPPSLS